MILTGSGISFACIEPNGGNRRSTRFFPRLAKRWSITCVASAQYQVINRLRDSLSRRRGALSHVSERLTTAIDDALDRAVGRSEFIDRDAMRQPAYRLAAVCSQGMD